MKTNMAILISHHPTKDRVLTRMATRLTPCTCSMIHIISWTLVAKNTSLSTKSTTQVIRMLP